MKYKAILYDMDGTLIPMDMKQFSVGYFRFLYEKCKGLSSLPDFGPFVDAVWKGTHAMARNDGTVLNRERFWETFCALTGMNREQMEPLCDDFYANEFKKAVMFTEPNPLAGEAIRISHEKAPIVALATNPLFPMAGQLTRMSWIGLTPADFDLVTAYETDSFCKPNPEYYRTVCSRLNVLPSECLMIGNDEREDMAAASSLGIDCYLVTDTAIYNPDYPWTGKSGSFAELVDFLSELEPCSEN